MLFLSENDHVRGLKVEVCSYFRVLSFQHATVGHQPPYVRRLWWRDGKIAAGHQGYTTVLCTGKESFEGATRNADKVTRPQT